MNKYKIKNDKPLSVKDKSELNKYKLDLNEFIYTVDQSCSLKSPHFGDDRYICHAQSGRWVKKTGPTGRAVLREFLDLQGKSCPPHLCPKPKPNVCPKPKICPKPQVCPKPEACPKPKTKICPKPEDCPKPKTKSCPQLTSTSCLQLIEKSDKVAKSTKTSHKNKVFLGEIFENLSGDDRYLTVNNIEAETLRDVRRKGVEIRSYKPHRSTKKVNIDTDECDFSPSHKFSIYNNNMYLKDVLCFRAPPSLGQDLVYELLMADQFISV